jgi:hypothetical protein
MKSLIWLGAIVTLVAILAIARPVFTTSQTRNVASVGDVKLQSMQQLAPVVPVALSTSTLAFGLVLIGVGLYAKRKARGPSLGFLK